LWRGQSAAQRRRGKREIEDVCGKRGLCTWQKRPMYDETADEHVCARVEHSTRRHGGCGRQIKRNACAPHRLRGARIRNAPVSALNAPRSCPYRTSSRGAQSCPAACGTASLRDQARGRAGGWGGRREADVPRTAGHSGVPARAALKFRFPAFPSSRGARRATASAPSPLTWSGSTSTHGRAPHSASPHRPPCLSRGSGGGGGSPASLRISCACTARCALSLAPIPSVACSRLASCRPRRRPSRLAFRSPPRARSS